MAGSDTHSNPLSRAEIGALVGVLAVLPGLLTWPLLPRFFTHVMAAPDQEAAPHIWGLWAAGQGAGILQLNTVLQAFPDGIELVLVDPLDLPVFHLGLLGGPAAAYNLLLIVGVVVMGLAGAALARMVDPQASPALGAVVGMACPTLLANAADGMTEGFGVGLVGLALAALVWAGRAPASKGWVAAGVLVGLTAWAGPYNAVWTAFLGLGLAGWALATRDWRRLAAVVRAGLVGTVLAAPVAAAIFGARDDALPGGRARAGLPDIVDNPAIFRGGMRTGADLLDPWLPGPLTGGEAEVSHTAYLGVVMLVAAAVGAWRSPRRTWPWVVGALCFAVLSLGPWLYFGGTAVRVGASTLAGPAGLMMLTVPVLGRLTRWYRAGAIASLLLVPAVVARVRRPWARVAIGSAVVVDVLLLAPLAWPLHHSPLPDASALLQLPGDGALLELPPVTSAEPPPGLWRDETALLQVMHGHPTGGAMMGLGVSPLARSGVDELRRLMRGEGFDGQLAADLREQGFRWVVIHTDFHPVPAASLARLDACLGQPVVFTERHRAWELAAVPAGEGCPSSATEP